ncbi:DUF5671 domain-containing protein [Leifsonia sp. YAF41]|uniref:DUF5671 domain-containing protein n=1 Tax=Leifsonia sp. YAF41 TaxID=3233086 RepID=UPI003F97C408
MSDVHTSAAPSVGSAQQTVRRVIVYVLLFALVTIGAIGLSGLLARLLETGSDLADGGTTGLALSLAFTLVGGPLAALLWWSVWRKLRGEAERSSLTLGLYLAGMYVVSLITFSLALVATASALVDGAWEPREFATGIVWAGVWLWHRWMWNRPELGQVRLRTVPIVLGSVYGLVLGVGGAVNALGYLFDTAIRGSATATLAGIPWWQTPLPALLSAIAGGAIWWWHWTHDDAKHLKTGFAAVALIVVGVLGASILTLTGIATVLFVLLRLAFDRSEPVNTLLDPLGEAIAAAAVGSLVWFYHWGVARLRSDATRRAGALVTSGVGVVAAAAGVGVILNAVLASTTTTLAGADARSLLFGGISALVVGGPVWWRMWRPTSPVSADEAGYSGRRVYLVAMFGLSAVVALIALLTVGYRVFEFALDPGVDGGLIEQVRAPLGWLVATGLVGGYHFSVWRHDRAVLAVERPTRERLIDRVILVTGADADAQKREIENVTGASVTVWRRAAAVVGAGSEAATGPAVGSGAAPDAGELARVLDGVAGKRVLVLTGEGGRVEVVPLAD